MVAATRTIEDERESLLTFKMPDLRIIAEEIGADTATSKAQIVENILAKKAGDAAELLPEGTQAEAAGEAEASTEAAAEPTSEDGREPEEAEVPEPPPVLVKHLMLTMFEAPDESIGILDSEGVNRRLEEWFARGYDPIEFNPIGFSPGGHRLLWILEKVDKPKYTRALTFMRLLTPTANPIRNTFSGFQADAYVSAFVEAGWTLFGAKFNGNDMMGESTMGIFIIWFLVR